ncbi:MAG: CDP-alcohol phosphatidyltransferase family protein [Candidatus Neomarinimicrobiota bacterium]
MTGKRDRIFTISNALSLFRAFLSIPLVVALEQNLMSSVLIMVILAVVSDFADGYLARRADEITNVGKLLDPIADKFIIMAVMISIIFDPVRRFPIFFFLILGLRDVTISIIGTYLMVRLNEVFETNITGKWFIGATTLAMALYLFRFTNLGFIILLVATALMLISWIQYLRFYIHRLHSAPAS